MTETAVAAPEEPRDPRPIRMLVLEDAMRRAISLIAEEHNEPGHALAFEILTEALAER